MTITIATEDNDSSVEGTKTVKPWSHHTEIPHDVTWQVCDLSQRPIAPKQSPSRSLTPLAALCPLYTPIQTPLRPTPQ